MSGAFEIAGIHARKTTDSGDRPAIEVEVRLAGGATGRAVFPIGHNSGHTAAVVRAAEDRPDFDSNAAGAVEYVNSVLAAALNSGDAYNREAIECLLRQEAAETGSRFPAAAGVLPAVSLAVSRACTAQLRVG